MFLKNGCKMSNISEIFIVDKINDAVPYTCNLKDLNGEYILSTV